MRATRSFLVLLLLLGIGCTGGGGGSPTGPTPVPGTTPVPLSPTDQLVRASMALRGLRPAVADLQQVQANPASLPGIVDAYLQTPEFGQTVRDMHNDWLLIRSEASADLLPAVAQASNWTISEIDHSLMEEPLKLVEYVVTNDRPYTEIVTANYTLADQIVATAWGHTDYAGTGPGDWRVVHWTDGRPAAGILDSSSLFFRHVSAGSNFNRGRANFISGALLCNDFLSRDVVIDTTINLADPTAVANAVVQNPTCASCHNTLDPLASFFMGYKGSLAGFQITTYPIPGWYSVAREKAWQTTNLRAPAYFGVAGSSMPDHGRLDDLGHAIAADDRFSLCTAERFYSWLTQTPLPEVPLETAANLQSQFIASGFNARELMKSIVLSGDFAGSTAGPLQDPNTVIGMKKATPNQLARTIADLTGFTWQTDLKVVVKGANWGLVELPTTDLTGYRVLGGGIDSYYVTLPTDTVNTTGSLFLRAFAAEAAGYVVAKDLALSDPASRKLLTSISGPTDTAETDVRTQLAALHLRLYGEFVSPSSPQVNESYSLFSSALSATGDPIHAWNTTLTGMLQDPKIAYY